MIAKLESGAIDPSYSSVKKIFSALENFSKKKEARVSEFMSRKLIFCGPAEKIHAVAKKMRSYIDSLDTAEELALKLIYEAEQKGMEISETKFKLRDAHQAKLEARTMVHSFSEQKFKDVVVGKGLSVTSASIVEAKEAVDNYFFRRYGLLVSVLIISLLSFTLYLYIKQIEKKQAEKQS